MPRSRQQDDALKRALSLALPTSAAGPASLLAAGVLPLGDGLLRVAQGTMRTAWTVARTAGAGADYVNRNVLVPAILKVNPLAMLAPAAALSSGRVRFAPSGQACELLQQPRAHHHQASTRSEAQHRRVQAGLKSGSVRCSMRSSSAVQPVALVASVAAAGPAQAAAVAPRSNGGGSSGTAPRRQQQQPSDDLYDASTTCGSWTMSLGLQSSML